MIEKTVLTEKIYTQYIPNKISYNVHHIFTKYIAENGEYICTINDEIVSKNEGNETFRNLISEAEDYTIEKTILNKNDMEIIEYIKGGIDEYVEYIDDYYQYKNAKDNNDRLYKLISKFKSIS